MDTRESPILRTETARTESLRRSLVGSRLESVTYVQTRYGGYAEPQDGEAHLVDLEVVLRLSTGTASITWTRDNLVEGLTVSPAEPQYDEDDHVYVSANPRWDGLIGHGIRDLSFGWHISEARCPLSLWAIRLTFDTGQNVVIALGELDEQENPTYHPDSLVVLFDERDARRYRPDGSEDSSWGGGGTEG